MVSRRVAIGLGLTGAATVAAGGWIASSYLTTIAAAEARVASGSETMKTSLGTLEYAIAGDGVPLLMIHGTGGGFDQGLAFCTRLIGRGMRVIAPSRFGYLRSDFPEVPSSENQADVLVELLDHLGIDRVAVAGGSAGALPALQFAIRHPDRCSGLLPIVPATYVPGRAPVVPSDFQLALMNAVLESDFLFWSAMTSMHDQMIATLLATDPEIVRAAPPDDQARVSKILRDILPVSSRARGLRNDARLAGNPQQMAIETIRVPTLAISVEDDRFGTCDAARYIAAQVPGAKLITYPTGGHVWVGHDAELFDAVHRFVTTLS
jgi:2-hydroxy-6-oxonona-2,4-dienedioate hydrolase